MDGTTSGVDGRMHRGGACFYVEAVDSLEEARRTILVGSRALDAREVDELPAGCWDREGHLGWDKATAIDAALAGLKAARRGASPRRAVGYDGRRTQVLFFRVDTGAVEVRSSGVPRGVHDTWDRINGVRDIEGQQE
jgi:hypothetical protein